jgi:hypothetical protein
MSGLGVEGLDTVLLWKTGNESWPVRWLEIRFGWQRSGVQLRYAQWLGPGSCGSLGGPARRTTTLLLLLLIVWVGSRGAWIRCPVEMQHIQCTMEEKANIAVFASGIRWTRIAAEIPRKTETHRFISWK